MGTKIQLWALLFLFGCTAVAGFGQNFSMSPNYIYPGKAKILNVNGFNTNFKKASAQTSVSFVYNTKAIYSPKIINILSDDHISFNALLPATAPAGKYLVKVHDSTDGDLITFAFAVAQPVTLIPDTIHDIKKTTLPIYLNANGLAFDTLKKGKFWFQKDTFVIKPGPITINESQRASFMLQIPKNIILGSYNLYIVTPGSDTVVAYRALTFDSAYQPLIKVIAPDTLMQETTPQMLITGMHTHFLNQTYQKPIVYLKKGKDSIPSYTYSFLKADTFRFELDIPYNADTGYYSLYIYDAYDGLITSPYKIHIKKNTNRAITYYFPDNAVPGSSFVMTIRTRNTNFKPGNAKVWLSQGGLKIYADAIKIVNTDTLNAHFTLPFNVLISAGIWTINVQDEKTDTIKFQNGFNIFYPSSPFIVSTTPDTLFRGRNNIIDIKALQIHFTSSTIMYVVNRLGHKIFIKPGQIVSPYEMAGNITPVSCDTGEIRLYYEDENGTVKTSTIVYLADYSAINNSSPEAPLSFTAYPNPFRNTITLTYNLSAASDINIQVFDMMGRQVWHENRGKQTAGRHSMEISFDGNENKAGMYVVRMQAGNDETRIKIIKTE